MGRPRVFLDFSVDNAPLGRVIFELYNDTAPKTSENFRVLCTGEKGLSALSELPLYYKNSIIHRSIKDFMIQGGDFTKRNGTGGESIYGSPFPDEDLSRPLDAEGLLCMANKGPDTNGSQFFVTLRDCSHLNGKHVVLGKVIRGYAEVVEKIADISVDQKDRPTAPVTISNCGELELRAKRQAEGLETERRKRSQSMSESDIPAEVRKSRRSRDRRTRSRSPGVERRPSKKMKHKQRRSSSRENNYSTSASNGAAPVAETEEEYDARLEREENERLEAERKKELERVKKQYDDAAQSRDGVRFKGRGRMKFVDPEVQQKRK